MVLTPDLIGSIRGQDALFFPLVFLHAVAALAGFGSVGFAGTYASRAAHLYFGSPPDEGPERASAPASAEMVNAGGVPSTPAVVPAEAAEAAEALEVAEAAAVAPRLEGRGETAGTAAGQADVDPEVEELTRYFQRPARFWKAILFVPVFGLLALWAQPRTKGLDQVWTLAGLLVWICATLVVVGLVVPALNQMRDLMSVPAGRPDDLPAEASRRARVARTASLASRGAAICDVLFFFAVALMIWQP